MPELRTRPVVVAVMLAALLGASAGLQAARDRSFTRDDPRERFLYLQSGEALRRIALSFDALAADIYWIRTLQHYGGDRLSSRTEGRFELLYPLLDLTTTLDPRFNIAYRFGAIFLSGSYPGGPARPDLAIALLKKGLDAAPQRWEYMQDIGFVYYWELGDFRSASEWFHRASQVPGAPRWLQTLAATTLALGGDRVSSRFLWQQIYSSAEDDWMRGEAERRLQQLAAMDQIDWLTARASAFAERDDEEPITWERLIRAGIVQGVPRDPTGVPYEVNPWWGTVTVSERSRLFPLPVGAAAAARTVPIR
jgi:tetratricopeptide (TPR) repeat protein